ncbi:histidine phosphatase family protein, partial [Natronoarchaeum mannanilyticum]|uniref:histidine phosphatase family protein n=1 Tax=Natronoarchaeum mannanilyticum TaxID=926360 RepID=UPI003606B63D
MISLSNERIEWPNIRPPSHQFSTITDIRCHSPRKNRSSVQWSRAPRQRLPRRARFRRHSANLRRRARRRRRSQRPGRADARQATLPQEPNRSTMGTVVLVRHGETDWNADRRIQGWAPAPLNDAGREQARALGEHV